MRKLKLIAIGKVGRSLLPGPWAGHLRSDKEDENYGTEGKEISRHTTIVR
jgi:hypothetical protein